MTTEFERKKRKHDAMKQSMRDKANNGNHAVANILEVRFGEHFDHNFGYDCGEPPYGYDNR